MNFKADVIDHQYRNKYIHAKGGSGSTVVGGGGSSIDTSKYDTAYDIAIKLNDWFYWKSDSEDDEENEQGSVHSKYNFVGDNEVSAFGKGDSSQTPSGGGILVNGKTIAELVAGDNVTIDTDSEEGKAIINASGGGEGGSTTDSYLPLTGGTLTGHLFLGDGNTTAFKKVETIRNIDNIPNGAAFYTNSDGTAAFFHKTYQTTGLTGAVNDAILKFDHNGLFFAKGDTERTTATDFKEVLTEATAYKKSDVYSKIECDSIFQPINDWFYKDEDGNVHSKYNFVGDNEVSAFGKGDSSQTPSGGGIWYNGQIITAVTRENNITLRNEGQKLIIGDNIDTSNFISSSDSRISGWNDAASKSHSHTNKTELDLIQTGDVSKWNQTSTDLNNWFEFKDNSVQCKFNFVGQHEVSAFGKGDSQGGGTGGYITVNGRNINTLKKTNHITFGGSGTELIIGDDINLDGYATTAFTNSTYQLKGNYLTGFTETDPTVQSWAKTGITYTEVTTSSTKVSVSDSASTANNKLSISGHSHTNKNALDLFYVSGGVVHCSESFVGDKEVSAFGAGDSSQGGSGSIKWGTTNITGITAGTNVTMSATNNVLRINATQPTKTSQLTNDSNFITTATTYVDSITAITSDASKFGGSISNHKLTISGHTHGNLAALSGITTAKTTSWDNAATDSHTHGNLAALSGITTAKTTAWDNVSNKYDKTGGTISGNCVITGNCNVSGNTIIGNANTNTVEIKGICNLTRTGSTSVLNVSGNSTFYNVINVMKTISFENTTITENADEKIKVTNQNGIELNGPTTINGNLIVNGNIRATGEVAAYQSTSATDSAAAKLNAIKNTLKGYTAITGTTGTLSTTQLTTILRDIYKNI